MYDARCLALRRPCAERAQTPDETFHCNDIFRACYADAPDPPQVVLEGGDIPLDTEIEIPLDAKPRLAQVMCHRDDAFYEFHDEFDLVNPDTWPEGAVQSCSDDGLTVSFGFAGEVSMCQSTIFPGDGNYPWPTRYPVPDWWPCEAAQE
jgi:hypothetical protein